MIEFLEDILVGQRVLLSIILLALITAVIMMKYWDRVKFWWTCTWYSFPVIGKISKLSKDITSVDEKGWFSSETTLCSDFHRYYDRFDKDPEHYDRCKSYLNKVGELGRRPFPFIMWIVVFALVILEALGFAYVLAGFTIPGASESLQQYGAFGIALIISIILVGFTHWAGHEMYENSVFKKIRTYYSNDRRDDKDNLEADNRITIEKNELDDEAKNYLQILNRVGKHNASVTPSWIITIITAIFVVIIAVGATYVRGQVLEKQLIEEKSLTTTNVYEQALPNILKQSQETADTKAFDEAQDSDRKGGWATFIVLAVLFIFIQLLGILFGFKWGFIGKESQAAFDDTNGFRSKQDFINYFKREKDTIIKIAEQKLKLLQQKMYQKGTMISTSAKEMEMLKTKDYRTFKEYVKKEAIENMDFHNDIEKTKEKTYVKSEVKQEEIKVETKDKLYSCLNCSASLDENSKFCNSCGTEVKKELLACKKCNASLDENAKFCNSCGEKVVEKELVPTCPVCQTTYEIGVKFCSNDGKELELV
ncbi:zinc ribbon domain-containing protein [Aliarcobacter cryaerophilus]|uniref:zinc ribbon domain-containing protein n=1 Tax=Aliarcobacter cryaerophilus TaxID=28198 RepID=UPI0021B4E5C6|nr:zinc ribbon domain-containing protein [Aliarcobacter cryaerophilus]MCT7481995.1 zinc ribbon domain-containing protein [Aliarcobacter cryaerophilus]